MTKQIQWCLDQHRNTNHMYDKYLPYEFHLRMVVEVFRKFQNVLLLSYPEIPTKEMADKILENVELACWGHDLIEDTRVTYNDVAENTNLVVADLVYALTNEKGRNRKERANEAYYAGIRNVRHGVFVKLCDRIANVQYSKMSGSRMFEMYRKENQLFVENLSWYENHPYIKLFNYLNSLFED